ncbi:MAG TPA: copper chaperone PCu(A)C [Salinisphaeraceae bacterium]|nr:copper chaperone PCu(A)C [Salinisphaeraceae bacterium]
MQNFFHATARRLTVLPVLLLCTGWAAAAGAACEALDIQDAWVRAPAGVPLMAGYMTITNSGDDTVELTAVSSPQFERAEVHESKVDEQGEASMQAVDSIVLPAGETVAFEPGSYHVMLFAPEAGLEQGDVARLVLHCGDSADTREVKAEIRGMAAGAGAMHGMHSEHMQHGD